MSGHLFDMPDGTRRLVAARYRYASPPPVGTLMGPRTTREYLVVIGHEDGCTLFGYPTLAELAAVRARVEAGDEPRSVTEHAGGV